MYCHDVFFLTSTSGVGFKVAARISAYASLCDGTGCIIVARMHLRLSISLIAQTSFERLVMYVKVDERFAPTIEESYLIAL